MSMSGPKTQVLLLAAGVGSRLRPLTDTLPKCLMPIAGKPLLEIWLEAFWADGIDRVLVNTHYLPDEVVSFVKGSRFASGVRLVHEAELLGTGGTLLANQDAFWDGPILVAHADNLTRFSPKAFLAAHSERPDGTDMTMMTFRTPDPGSCGILELDSRGVVRAFHEKVKNPPGNLANAAVYVFEPAKIFPLLRSKGRAVIDLSTEVIPDLVGRIATFENTRYHRDIGTIESLTAAQFDFPVIDRDEGSWSSKVRSLGQHFDRSARGLKP